MLLSLLVTIAGFIIGLGAVTVIDLHGFLGRTSGYWTEATIRTHKVTKPLIWCGMILVTLGTYLLFCEGVFGIEAFRKIFIIELVMVLNGCFLSFIVSTFLLKQEREGRSQDLLPQSLQYKIAVSFVVSFISWWGLLVYILMFVAK